MCSEFFCLNESLCTTRLVPSRTRRTSDPLEPELEMAVSHFVAAGSSGKASSALLNHGASL